MFGRSFFKTTPEATASYGESLERNPLQMEETLSREMEEIRRLDPSVRSIKDILAMPTGETFRMYVKKGNSFVDAYFLANRQEILRSVYEAGAAQGRNRGKEHLTATTSHMAPMMAEIPGEELELFRGLLPEVPDTIFRAYYQRNKM